MRMSATKLIHAAGETIPSNAKKSEPSDRGILGHRESHSFLHSPKHVSRTNAVEEVYLSPPQNPITGYKNVTANNLLCHLFVEYGEIGPRETQANEQHFNEAWDGAELFETIITRITDWVAYATSAGKPYTDAQILDRAELIVLNTGLYDDDMKEWGRMTCAEQTYGNFYGE